MEKPTELNPDVLDKVTGGTVPVTPDRKDSVLRKLNHALISNELSGVEVTSSVAAFCLSCGRTLSYLGQDRVEGGLTDQFKCTNPACPEYNRIKCNDEVKK